MSKLPAPDVTFPRLIQVGRADGTSTRTVDGSPSTATPGTSGTGPTSVEIRMGGARKDLAEITVGLPAIPAVRSIRTAGPSGAGLWTLTADGWRLHDSFHGSTERMRDCVRDFIDAYARCREALP